jgi:hypothetical protein
LPVDASQWQGKFQIQTDAYPNVLVLGYPAPPIPPPTLGQAADGGGKKHRPLEIEFPQKRFDHPGKRMELRDTETPDLKALLPLMPALERRRLEQELAEKESKAKPVEAEPILAAPEPIIAAVVSPVEQIAVATDDDDEEAILLLLH